MAKDRKRMNPDEEQSIVGKLGSSVMSPLAAVGNLLGLPGSMVVDVLAGENPFDQLRTPMQDVNRVTGRELLQRRGIVSDAPGVGGHALGIAADIALDPLTYMSFGLNHALTEGGKALRAAGGIEELSHAATKAANVSAGTFAGSQIGKREAMASMSLNEALDVLRTPRGPGSTLPRGAWGPGQIGRAHV